MKFKNKDGTVNSLPIVIIFSVVAIASYLIIFGVDFKEEVKNVIGDNTTTTTKTTEKTTIKLCNGCSMRFNNTSYDVSTNGEVDLASLMILDKISIRDVTFKSSNDSIMTIQPKGSTYYIATGNQDGTATVIAEYADITIEATINIIQPSKSEVKFKYPYYFVGIKEKIEPEIVTYPLGYNTNGITFDTKDKGILGVTSKKNAVTGKVQGEGSYTLNIGNSTSTTTIYVVPNVISVKVDQGGIYKTQREITPVGDEFNVAISFEDNNRNNYDQKDITISFPQTNGLTMNAGYLSKSNEYNSYIYLITAQGTGSATMKVELPDGSFTLFEIKK